MFICWKISNTLATIVPAKYVFFFHFFPKLHLFLNSFMYNSLKSPVLDSLYVINIIIIVIVIFCYYQYNDKI